MYICIHVYVYMYICIYVYMYICIHVYIYVLGSHVAPSRASEVAQCTTRTKFCRTHWNLIVLSARTQPKQPSKAASQSSQPKQPARAANQSSQPKQPAKAASPNSQPKQPNNCKLPSVFVNFEVFWCFDAGPELC